MRYTFASDAEAASDLEANGWTHKPTEFGDRWTKPSKVDDWYGGYACTAIVAVERRHVAPEYGQPDYFELRFI